MPTLEINAGNFAETIEKNKIVLLDCWAPWCGPCRVFAPIFEAAATRLPDVLFARLNTEDEPELAASFEIRAIPTLMVFRDGILLFSQPGMFPRASSGSPNQRGSRPRHGRDSTRARNGDRWHRVSDGGGRTVMLRAFVSVCSGALLGFAYHRLVGCRTGACPLTANPYISTLWGAMLGYLVAGRNRARHQELSRLRDAPASFGRRGRD